MYVDGWYQCLFCGSIQCYDQHLLYFKENGLKRGLKSYFAVEVAPPFYQKISG
jgi:hypothetical protein